MRKTLFILMLLMLVCWASGQSYSYRYWIDNNVGSAVSGSGTGESQFSINTSALTNGFHILHIQARNAAGVWSSVRTRYFLRHEEGANLVGATARYWIDNDMTTMHNGVATSGVIELDIPELSIGLHAVHYQKIAANGIPSSVRTRYFIKHEESSHPGATARYWIDNDLTTMHNGVATSGIIELDISKLDLGMHAVHFQKIASDGTPSPVRTRFFLIDRLPDSKAYSAAISIDDGEATVYAINGEDIVIDIGELEGEHQLHIVIYDDQQRKLDEKTLTFDAGQKEPEPDPDETDVSMIANTVYINKVVAHAGSETTLSIRMKNTAAIRGFQFDLCLPEGVTAVKNAKGKILGELNASRLPEDDEHQLTFSEHEGGVVRFLCSSMYDETFTGNDGAIATLQVNIADDMPTGKYAILLKNIKLTETDISKFYTTELLESTLAIVSSSLRGDANGDGVVDVADVVAIVNYILEKPADNFNFKAADVNNDEVIDAADVVGVVNIILDKGSINAARVREVLRENGFIF